MGLIRKLLGSKTEMETYIIKYGMKKAVKTYSLEKLVKDGFLTNIDRTQLYIDKNFSFKASVFDKQGQYLGDISCLMNPFYKQLGNFDTSCLNGNVILTCSELNGEKFKSRTYGVFSNTGEQIIPYGKYFTHEYVPNGVALINGYGDEDINVVTIRVSGAVDKETYFEIEEVFPSSCDKKIYQTKTKTENGVKIGAAYGYGYRPYTPFDD